jgi:hypothetical protein
MCSVPKRDRYTVPGARCPVPGARCPVTVRDGYAERGRVGWLRGPRRRGTRTPLERWPRRTLLRQLVSDSSPTVPDALAGSPWLLYGERAVLPASSGSMADGVVASGRATSDGLEGGLSPSAPVPVFEGGARAGRVAGVGSAGACSSPCVVFAQLAGARARAHGTVRICMGRAMSDLVVVERLVAGVAAEVPAHRRATTVAALADPALFIVGGAHARHAPDPTIASRHLVGRTAGPCGAGTPGSPRRARTAVPGSTHLCRTPSRTSLGIEPLRGAGLDRRTVRSATSGCVVRPSSVQFIALRNTSNTSVCFPAAGA